jgi:uncharacterized membrane protein
MAAAGMMQKERLNAFSDGVLAIIITIMVLELKVPHGDDWNALSALWPVFVSYVLSFAFIGIYWNNHHHLMHASHGVNASVMWANMHLLFWLSLLPFATGWMGENHFAPLPVAVYGAALLMPAIAYYILQRCIIRANGADRTLANALGRDFKGKMSPLFCIAGIGFALVDPRISCALYVALALLWLVPDRRIEKTVGHS